MNIRAQSWSRERPAEGCNLVRQLQPLISETCSRGGGNPVCMGACERARVCVCV